MARRPMNHQRIAMKPRELERRPSYPQANFEVDKYFLALHRSSARFENIRHDFPRQLDRQCFDGVIAHRELQHFSR